MLTGMRKLHLLTISSALALTLSLLAAPAFADSCGGVSFSSTVEVNGTTLSLNGLGIREATVFNVNVYVAGLYVENRSSSGSSIAGSDETRRLLLRFVRDVDEGDIEDAFEAGFRANGGRGMDSQIRELNGWMADMEEGDRLQFTYVPGVGLEVKVRSRVRGVIEGAEFAEAFFSIWLGSEPPNAGLKSGLLGGSCG